MEFDWSSNEAGDDGVEEILERLEALHDTEPSMSHLDHEARTAEFWNSLEPDQLHYIRTMLYAIVTASDTDTQASYHLGAAEAILRVKFRLCPRCAQSHDAEDCLRREVTNAKHNYRAVCEQYNVVPEDVNRHDFMVGGVRCKSCSKGFNSLAARIYVSGEDCPGCTVRTTPIKKG